MKKHMYTIIIGLVVILAVGAFFVRQDSSETATAALEATAGEIVAGEEAPSLGSAPETTIQNADGTEIAFADVIERNSIVNSWASWCPFCVDELPDFAEFAAENEGRVDVIVVNRAESIRKGESFLEELGLADTKMRVFYDEDESLYRGLGGFSMPETVFIDAEGEIRFHKRGPLRKSDIEQIINNLNW
ncbi:MAG: TlpA family protein disulfide reductase [Candidatus Pacebacteria bacterium]|nr:TlpA family protein disulfide reductase [Candidatus Paceibacterota bacterium]